MDNNENLRDEGDSEQEDAAPDDNIDHLLEIAGFNEDIVWGNSDSEDEDEEEIEDDGEMEVPENERLYFDTVATTSHHYLNANEDVNVPIGQCWIEETECVKVPVIRQNVVVFPGQTVPLQTIMPSDRQAIRIALNDKCYIALQTCLQDHRHGWYQNNDRADEDTSFHGQIGTLLLPLQINDDGTQIKAVMIGKQRCRFLNYESTFTGARMATVQIISGFTMQSLEYCISPNNLRKLTSSLKAKFVREMSGIPSSARATTSLKKNCELLAQWMKLWHTVEQIKAELEQMTLLVCSNCENNISKIENIIKMSSDSTSGHFVNNNGYIHDMLTLKEASDFRRRGKPTDEYSWFPGYKWQIVECNDCGQHLGWEFSSKKLLPAKFYGLTRKAVIPHMDKGRNTDTRIPIVGVVLRLLRNAPRLEFNL